jgi:predicted pyridoxine 5'-phosphate oxidase superfamily flavin-nucleotide-binding protein
MARAFTRIAFSAAVKAAQLRHGSREAYRRLEQAAGSRDTLGEDETGFISARDSFYQATVTEDGWPYVQHRGGPTGFLHVLDAHTLAYADYSGNKQYLSVGNLATNDRIALILMDYAHQVRLKVWGRARLVESPDADLLARVNMPGYAARIERVVLIAVEAFDWNCPRHITPRYSADEIEALLAANNPENTP